MVERNAWLQLLAPTKPNTQQPPIATICGNERLLRRQMIILDKLTPEALRTLTASGWRVGRSSGIDIAVQHLASFGIAVPEVARQALAELHGLVLEPMRGFDEGIRFDVVHATLNTSLDCFKAMGQVLHQGICPIGAGRDWLICVGERKGYFIIHDQFTTFFECESLTAAVNRLCTREHLMDGRIPIDWDNVPESVWRVLFPSGL